MTRFAEFSFAVSNKSPFHLRVFHVFNACANKEMIRVDTKRVVTTMASVQALNMHTLSQ